MPINLDIDSEKLQEIESQGAEEIALRDFEGNLIAVMNLEDAWKVDKGTRSGKSVWR